MSHVPPATNSPVHRLLLLAVAATLTLSACGVREDSAAPPQASQAPTVRAEQPLPPSRQPTLVPTAAVDSSQGQVAPTPVPTCTFGGIAGSEPQEPALEAYTFAEPQVLLSGQSISISGWLPDSRRVLITRADHAAKKQAIEIWDVQRGQTQRWGERLLGNAPPLWLEAQQSVAFTDGNAQNQIVLRTSQGPGASVAEAAQELASPHIAANPDGRQLLFATRGAGTQLQVLDLMAPQPQARPIAPPLPPRQPQQQAQDVQGRARAPLQAAWSPTGTWTALYNDTGFYLQDTASEQLCTVELGMHPDGPFWAASARWSPQGRFLALLTNVGSGPPFAFRNLVVLDTVTGQLRTLEFGTPFVFETVWGPSDRYLLALGRVARDEDTRSLLGLFLIDVFSGVAQRVLPEKTFASGHYDDGAGGVAWSPDGTNVLVKCPLLTQERPSRIAEDRICLISVTP